MKSTQATGSGNYFEDFVPGAVLKHARAKTLEPLEQVLITNLVMNSSTGHLDEEKMKSTQFGRRISFGGVNISLVVGLAAQDTAENALAELGMDGIRLTSPVFHGDTLTAYSEVVETGPSARDDAGIVRFRHYGVNQREQIVFEGERTVLIKRRSHWVDR